MDISSAVFLSQAQLNGMLGDSGTKIPDHLERPESWPVLEEKEAGSASDDNPSPQTDSTEQLKTQVRIILAKPAEALHTATIYADQIDCAVQLYREGNHGANELPQDLALVENFANNLRSISRAVKAPSTSREKKLEDEISKMNKIIEDLIKKITEIVSKDQQPSTGLGSKFASAFVISNGVALGTGTAAALLGAGEYFLGPYGAASLEVFKAGISKLLGS